MKLLDITRVFGMNVNRFCEFTGYSREGLHLILNHKIKGNPRRWVSAMNALELYVEREYNLEIKQAEENRQNRLEMIKRLNQA